ncbi:hypothetical protein O0L34_g1907 [Tuta absoluta]|nr:hypothetical protein O0L34_g1907 [Tuta absoluta]
MILGCSVLIQCQFMECHDDGMLHPEDGPLEELGFSWLGVLQYIHIKNGTPHYFRVPRVALITRQFVLSTAVDAAEVPEGYALGNIVFGDYERDANECDLTQDEIAAGADCPPAVLLMPISDVLLHPEYKHFGAKNSLAVLKLLKKIKSDYVVPVCLPFRNYAVKRDRRQTHYKFTHVDYFNDVPRSFIDESKEVTRLSLLPRELCYLYDEKTENSTHFVKDRMACTTSCGLHSGAPSLVHEHTGHWSIVALSLGGSTCPDLMRPRRPASPPKHILIYPYVPWLTAAIAGKAVGGFAKDDPFGLAMPRAINPHDILRHSWIGHWYMGGPRCYDRADQADDIFLFYHEIFQAKPDDDIYMNYYIEIDGMHGTNVICCKIGLPFRLGKPHVSNLNSPVARITISGIHFFSQYQFQVLAFGYNTTFDEDSSSSSDYSSCSNSQYCS